jgi:hypothetical protein
MLGPDVAKMDAVFRALTLAETVASTFGAWRAFEANRLPATWRFARGVASPTLTMLGPELAKMDAVFKAWIFAEVAAKTLGA